MKSLDLFIEEGSRLLEDSANPVDAYSAHDEWAQGVQQWLAEQSPNSGLTGEWAAFGSSPLVYGGGYYDEPAAWVSHMALIRRRLKWLSEKGSATSEARITKKREQSLARLTALRDQVADAVSFDWSDLHYSADLTLEFFDRYSALRDELKSIDPEVLGDLPLRNRPPIPTDTNNGLIAAHIPSRYFRTLLADMNYILKLHSRLTTPPVASVPHVAVINDESQSWDVFISHATEDKEAVAEPLSRALMKAGVSVWYDAFSLKVGDSLMSSIDFGLRKSKFGIVVLSKAFFRKDWPQRELRALAQKQSARQKVILPIWHDVTVEAVRDHFLLLADVVALKWSDGIQIVVNRLLEVIAVGGSALVTEDRDAQLRERATMSPRHAITEKWSELTEAILNAGMRNEGLIKSTEKRNPSEIVNVLSSTKLLNESDKETFFSLKKWHFGLNLDRSGPVEPQDAVTFAALADQLKAKLAST
jgi:hypothetical protein